MLIPFSRVCRDFLAVRGESPDLLPVLEDGEDSAVLTLEAWLRVMIIPKAVEATLAVPLDLLDEVEETTVVPTVSDGFAVVTLPDNLLRFISVSIGENPIPVSVLPDLSALRFSPSNRAHRDFGALDFCGGRFLRKVSDSSDGNGGTVRLFRLPDGRLLAQGLSTATPLRLRYIPIPFLDSSDLLHISLHAYHHLLKI